MRRSQRICSVAAMLVALTAMVAVLGTSFLTTPVFADQSPNGPGQPGAPGTTCGSPNANATPGNAVNTNSVFNGSGQASSVYAGNPGTASLANANSANAVSQYDIACFQAAQH